MWIQTSHDNNDHAGSIFSARALTHSDYKLKSGRLGDNELTNQCACMCVCL